ncbi:MAG: 2-hydroxyacid dehydrogenase [Planctomycetes bacterium]|nr:2-hydroxyacid dehydrogenase [Planctomycetota bacterium]
MLNPTHLEIIEWAARDEAELHHRVRQIEQFGPGAHSPPVAVWKWAREAELIVTHLCPLGADLIEQAVNLRMIGVCRAGTENVDQQAVQARGIRLYQVPGRNAVAVAEFTVGLILAERRNIARAHLSLVTGGWRKNFANDGQFSELAGKTVGLVGFGAVGQMVAARLAPFGVQFGVHDPFQSCQVIERHGGRALPLPELLCCADVVSLHARRGPHEPPLIGAAELALMKPTAVLINTARAHLVDTDALVQVLQHRRIAGAALDVFEQEPLPEDSPLRRLDNITLTPHLAGSTLEAFHQSPRLLAERIRQDMELRPDHRCRHR